MHIMCFPTYTYAVQYSINDLQLSVNRRFTIYALFCMRIVQYAYNRKRIK